MKVILELLCARTSSEGLNSSMWPNVSQVQIRHELLGEIAEDSGR